MLNLLWVLLEIVLVSVHDRCTVCAKRTRGLGIILGHAGWYCLVATFKWKLVLVHLEIVLILIQDRCTVCAKRTIALKIILDAPD
jgi:hypothetical protein